MEKSFKDTLFSNIDSLTKEERGVFERIYRVNTVTGGLVVPDTMRTWVVRNFGDINNVERQEVVKITNLITYEGSVFNDLRGKRPETKIKDETELTYESCGKEPFCDPITKTPEDVFGRIQGKYCVTAANIAKIDAFHSLIIFKDHNPLDFSAEKIHDYFEVADEYFKKVNEHDKSFVYPLFFWNALWRAGASLVHGHAQVTVTRDVTYSKIGLLRTRSLWYQETYKSNYFGDLFGVHKNLGLGFETQGIKIVTDLCPIKEKGITLFAKDFNGSLSFTVNNVLRHLVSNFGVRSFNLIAIPPPIASTYESWEHMPIIIQIVDRGDLASRHSDFASMELFAQSVVGSNPYTLINALKKGLCSS